MLSSSHCAFYRLCGTPELLDRWGWNSLIFKVLFQPIPFYKCVICVLPLVKITVSLPIARFCFHFQLYFCKSTYIVEPSLHYRLKNQSKTNPIILENKQTKKDRKYCLFIVKVFEWEAFICVLQGRNWRSGSWFSFLARWNCLNGQNLNI